MVTIELMPDFVGGDPQAPKRAKVPGLEVAANDRFACRATTACDEDQAHVETFLADELVDHRNVFVGRLTAAKGRERIGSAADKNDLILFGRQHKTHGQIPFKYRV